MANRGNIQGKNFSLSDGTIRFFASEGYVKSKGDWVANFLPLGANAHTAPVSTLSEIQNHIATAVNDGQNDMIGSVVLNPLAAVFLYLEGFLTLEHLARATGNDSMVVIPDVLIDGRTLPIVIHPGADPGVQIGFNKPAENA